MKEKVFYSCVNCNYQTLKWLGCCPECNQWNTIEKHFKSAAAGATSKGINSKLVNLANLQSQKKDRIKSGINEWDRVAGGGLMPGEFLVLTGDPGIGKSTLLMMVANAISKNHKVFYFSTEESLEQVKQRAQRLNIEFHDNFLFSDEFDLDNIIFTAKSLKPDLLIIDSIQNCQISNSDSLPGSINQLKEAAFKLMRLAKENEITLIVTGHITKEGLMAGPKALEHIVDAVFYLQAEDRFQTRILRSVKNRFGNIMELGFFQMEGDGMHEVYNINEHLIQGVTNSPGSALVSVLEGSRPLLIELQALTVQTKFAMPQRLITGIDQTQVVLIAAILEKYLQIKMSFNDIFFKVGGGFKIKGHGTDLAIAAALLSSYFQKSLPEKALVAGEIGLTGKIKPINQLNVQLGEAQKFGIKKIFISQNQKIEHSGFQEHRFDTVYDLLTLFE